jgi:tetratricopeptide (TPR) repeat protein
MTDPLEVTAAAALERGRAALEGGDAERALAALAPIRPALSADAALARLWAEALRRAPAHASLESDAASILTAHGHDATVVVATVAALVACAELRAPDEPPLRDGAAALAARASRACLDALPAAARRDPAIAGYLLVNLGAALRLLGIERDGEAVAAFEEALALDARRSGWWFALGVCHKWRGRFAAALTATQRARALLPPDAPANAVRPILFNLAICATALGQGDVAAEALAALGIPAMVSRGGLPMVEGLPPVEVRVPTRGSGHSAGAVPDRALSFEVVRVAPLSPVHGVVETPTFRDAPVDYGDVVLWDAAPVSVRRTAAGARIACFPLLERLRKGDEFRFRFLGLQQKSGDVEQVAAALPAAATLVVQEERVEHVCPRCAAGDVLTRHEHQPPDEHRLVTGKIVGPASLDLRALRDALDGVARTHPGVFLVVPGVHEALGDTAAAGKAHKAWSGLERTGVKRAGLAG